MDYVDSITSHVLGVGRLKSRLNPDSTWAKSEARRLPLCTEFEGWNDEIQTSQAVETWANSNPEKLARIRTLLGRLPALETVLALLETSETLGEGDLFEVKRFVHWGPQIVEAVRTLDPNCESWVEQLSEARRLIHPESKSSSRFRLVDELDMELASSRNAHRSAKIEFHDLRGQAEGAIIAAHGGRFDLKGLYHPAGLVPEDGALQLTPEGYRVANPKVHESQRRLSQLETEVATHETRVCKMLSQGLLQHVMVLQTVRDWLGDLDIRLAKGRLREELGGCWPTWGERLRFTDGYDPNLPEVNPQRVSVDLESGATVITGPNMGGKSALLRALGLAVWAAQHALPVAARAFEFEPVHQIVYVGAEQVDDAPAGLSSFGAEVVRLRDAWDGPVPRLFVLDELARGTHPDEGGSIAVEVITKLAQQNWVLAATHFPAVAAMNGVQHLRIRGLDHAAIEALDPSQLDRGLRDAMDYGPEPVGPSDHVGSDARIVARALGLPLET